MLGIALAIPNPCDNKGSVVSMNYKKLGNIVELIDERNKDGKVQNLIGVSIDKCFIKSVANTIGTDLTKYQVIRKNDFACSLMQVSRDGKIPIACLKDYDEAIMSPAYYIFRIKNSNEVLPDYLAMWFMRTEFDREASYIAVGGVRGSMPWEDFCDMKLPVPELKEQEKIVNTYNAITKRIQLKQKINENLEKTAQCLFNEYYRKENLEKVILSDLVDVRDGTHDSPVFITEGYPLVTSQNLSPFYINQKDTNKISKSDYEKINERSLVETNDILMSMIGTVGNVSLVTDEKVTFAIKNVALLKTSKTTEYRNWVLCFLKSSNFTTWLNETLTGSTQQYVSLGEIRKISLKIPTINELNKFNLATNRIINMIIKETAELVKLQELKQLVISRISGM